MSASMKSQPAVFRIPCILIRIQVQRRHCTFAFANEARSRAASSRVLRSSSHSGLSPMPCGFLA